MDSLLPQQSGPPDAATELAAETKRGQPATSSLQQAATEAKHGQAAASNEVREQLKSRLLNRMKDSSSQQGVGGVRDADPL